MDHAQIIEYFKTLPADHFVKAESFTKELYRDEYDAIDPKSPALSQEGKVVLITGASQGIGALGFAKQFAKAGAKAIILAARNADKLSETEKFVKETNPSVATLCIPTDVTKETSVKALFDSAVQKFGKIDVLINNAGVSTGHTTVDQMNLDEWWLNFEVNIKGLLLASKYFTQQIGSSHGTLISIASTGAFNDPEIGAGYTLSKMAGIKFVRQLAVSRPNLTVVALHPGMVKTATLPVYMEKFGLDTPELAGGVAVWLTTEKAKFLSGRYISANWSVTELEARREEILGSDQLRVNLVGKIGLED